MAVLDKRSFVADYIGKYKLRTAEILYMGDDLPDLPAMDIVGLAACPADAAPEIIQMADYISPIKGGFGCVRDVIEKVLKVHNQWHYRDDVASR
jgi:3-deoxy-D-manno-octulosonate 8-phosphate phosphatase (KDO 8-P phosphatase)